MPISPALVATTGSPRQIEVHQFEEDVMADHVLNWGRLAEAVGNDIADMAHFWMLRKFQFLEPAREQFEIIVDPWLSYCEEPS